MSVGVKTPTRSQFEHAEFPCGEIVNSASDLESRVKPAGNKASSSGGHNLESIARVKYENNHNVKHFDGRQVQTASASFRNGRHEHYRKRRYSQPQKTLENTIIGGLRKRRLASQIDFKGENRNIKLPTKFLLGGNINDPLNLNGLYEDDDGKLLNESTPQSSPLPIPSHRNKVEVKIPPNITDPLKLELGDIDTNSMINNKKRKRFWRHKRKNIAMQQSSNLPKDNKNLAQALKIEIDISNDNLDDLEDDLSLDIQSANLSKINAPNKIVSPVVPQPSPKMKRRRMTISDCRAESSHAIRELNRSFSSPDQNKVHTHRKTKFTSPIPPKFVQHPKFIHGNYNRYYGYRNPSKEEDHRMENFDSEWFECKDVLDIGCNVGHLTMLIAKEFLPKKIVGMDIDGDLIKVARKNIRQYMSSCTANVEKYPVSNSANYGPISAPIISDRSMQPKFPNNLIFIQGDFVLEDDSLMQFQSEEYDLILALSITKWIHLNHGDAGLKRVFKRIHKQLRPGGKLILEPQPWSSYRKRNKLTENIYENFKSIELKPDAFSNYLLTEVGFSKCEVIAIPFNKSKGFRRPLQLYTKTDTIANTPNLCEMEESISQKTMQEEEHSPTSSGVAQSSSVEESSAMNETMECQKD